MTDFDIYLERYCKQYGYTKEEAKEHALIKEVQQYYNEQKEGVVNR